MNSKYSLNLNIEEYKRRDEIIFGEEVDWNGGVVGGHKPFKKLTVEKLEELIEGNFIDIAGKQNNSPTAQQFLEFMKQHSGTTAHGYAISPLRDDYRVTIEGVESWGVNDTEVQLTFTRQFRHANDLKVTATHLYCWYD